MSEPQIKDPEPCKSRLTEHNAALPYDEADLERDRETLRQLREKATNSTP